MPISISRLIPPPTMRPVVTTGNGGYDRLEYRQVPTPAGKIGKALIGVLAVGRNSTEIYTRLGWYSSNVTDRTGDLSVPKEQSTEQKADGGWNDATPFLIIQRTDCYGRVVALGGDDRACANLLGRRVLIRACM